VFEKVRNFYKMVIISYVCKNQKKSKIFKTIVTSGASIAVVASAGKFVEIEISGVVKFSVSAEVSEAVSPLGKLVVSVFIESASSEIVPFELVLGTSEPDVVPSSPVENTKTRGV
jgi:hypothetical protein